MRGWRLPAGGDVQLVVEDKGQDGAGADEVVEAEGVDRGVLSRPVNGRMRNVSCVTRATAGSASCATAARRAARGCEGAGLTCT
jgi:hypothetical protein